MTCEQAKLDQAAPHQAATQPGIKWAEQLTAMQQPGNAEPQSGSTKDRQHYGQAALWCNAEPEPGSAMDRQHHGHAAPWCNAATLKHITMQGFQ